MRNLLLFLQKYYYWFVFLILEIISLALLFQYNRYQGSVYFTSANAVSGCIYEMQSRITSYFSLQKLNEDLTNRNIQLSMELSELRKLYEAKEDTAFNLEDVSRVLDNYPSVHATVVSATLNRTNNFLTINKGDADGVKAEMGVLGGNGLVGVVFKTTRHYALVLPLINTSSNISCKIRGRGYYGYLRWDAKDSRYAMLEDVPRHASFKKGDLVETSGYSEMFPEGVAVGKVEAIYNSADGLSFQLKVRLATDFGRIRDVHVVQHVPDLERKVLQETADSLERKEKRKQI